MLLAMNLWAALVAALSMFVLGGIWYSPWLFGRVWCREAGTNCMEQKGHKIKIYIWSFILSLISAVVFGLFLGPEPSLELALIVGVSVGLCWVGTSFGVNYLFSGRSLKLFLIDAGYHTLQFIVYGLIFGLWH